MLRQPHIFISFKSEERTHAEALKAALEQGGFSVWWQENIQCGREWHGDIDTALLSAGCVVVLWTAASVASPWVRHEASQAVARGVYTPVRLDPMAIGSPFDRIQATDLFDWKGEPGHPGLRRLLARADQLIPQPLSPIQRSIRFLRTNLGVIASSAVAAASIGILIFLSIGLERQLAAQSAIAESIQRTLHPLSDMRISAYLDIAPDVPGVPAYVSRLRDAVPLSPDGTLKRDAILPTGIRLSSATDNKITALSIPYGSPLWPSDTPSSWLDTLTRYSALEVRFWQAGRPLHDNADLTLSVGAYDPDGSEGQRNTANIEWDIATGRLTVTFTDTATQRWWDATGQVVSIPDLEKSTIRIATKSTMYKSLSDSTAMAGVKASRAGLALNIFFLRVSGRDYTIRNDKLRAAVNAEGLREYTGDFARSIDVRVR
jgi:hypothetical protein